MALRRAEEAENLGGHALFVVVLDAWALSGSERSALRDFPVGAGRTRCPGNFPWPWPGADSAFPCCKDWSDDSRRSAAKPSKEGWHADHGWTADPGVVHCRHDPPRKSG